MADEIIPRGKLKLKGVGEPLSSKQKRRKKEQQRLDEEQPNDATAAKSVGGDESLNSDGTHGRLGGKLTATRPRDTRTPAQKRFEEIKKQREDLHIKRQAAKSHKERVKDFNAHLNALSEHYDIPKVGPG